MFNGGKTVAGLLDLQSRIQELKHENDRLSGELKKQKRRWESELHFRTLADSTPAIIWVTDALGRMEFINQAYTEFFGRTLDEFQEGTWERLVHPEDQASYIGELMECLQEQRAFHQQCRVLRKDGSWRWIIFQAQPRFSESGSFLGMAGSSFDITEQIHAEDVLKESQSMLAETQRIAGIGSWRWDIPTSELRWSDELYAIYETDRNTFTPSMSSFNDYIHPDDRLMVLQNIEQISAAAPSVNFEFRIVSRTGREHVLKTVGQVIKFDTDGNPLIMIGANEDITDQKRAERALRESEEHFRVAIKNSPIIVYTTDQDLRYTWVYNPPFGMEPEQILGKTDEELNGRESAAQLTAFKRSVLETGIGKRQEIEWPYQGGIYFYDVTAEPVRDEKGKITGLTVAVIDITQKKQLEKEAQEDQVRIKLQGRLIEQREQERLAIAQEIHDGPTQTLAGTLLELQMARDIVNDPALKAELEQIELHMKSAVQELREIISGLRPVLLQRFGFSEAIQQHARDFKEKHPTIGITYATADDQGKLSKDISVSLFRIYQEAIRNVAQHAAASQANVRFSFEEEAALLEIEDNGKGMDSMPDPVLLIGEGHYGLVGMKERVEAVGGQFQLRTSHNQGTNITVKIPLNRQQS